MEWGHMGELEQEKVKDEHDENIVLMHEIFQKLIYVQSENKYK